MLLVEDDNIVCPGQQLPFPRKQPQSFTADKAGLPTVLPPSFSEASFHGRREGRQQTGSSLCILCSGLLREQSPWGGQCSSSLGRTETQDSSQFQLHLNAWCSASALRGYGAFLSFRPCLSHHMSPAAPLPDSSVFEFIVIHFNYIYVCISAIIFNYAYVCMPVGWYMHMKARVHRLKVLDPPGEGVTDCSEPPDVGAGSPTWTLRRRSVHTLNHWALSLASVLFGFVVV